MNILFLGGDKRYKIMIEDLSKTDNVYQIGFEIKNDKVINVNIKDLDLSKFDIILFPITGINDNLEIKSEVGLIKLPYYIFNNIKNDTLIFTGLKTKKMLELLEGKAIISFLENEDVKKVNDFLTVDGVIDDIKNKKNDKVCILGYGVLGKEIYLRLKNVKIKTFVISRPKQLIYDDNVEIFYPLNSQNIIEVFKICDIAINTIPCNIITEEIFESNHIPYILDIASSPYGISQEVIKKHKDKVNYHLYSGIPSVFAPKEASAILLKTLKNSYN